MKQCIAALISGFKLCFLNKKIRKLAIKPWLIGTVCYFTSIYLAYQNHGTVVNWVISDPTTWWMNLAYYLVWLFAALALILVSLIASVAIVLILSGYFQTAIALEVLKSHEVSIPEEDESITGVAKEAGRSIMVESLKLLWLGPLFILVFIVGFIPFLTPVAICLGAWLLAYQFIDIVLDIQKHKAGYRLKFSLKNWILLLQYGLLLTFVCLVPFLAIFIPPVAVAGAGVLLAKTGLIAENGPVNATQSKQPVKASS